MPGGQPDALTEAGRGVAAGAGEAVYVSDYNSRRIQKFLDSGTTQATLQFSSSTYNGDEFNGPDGSAPDAAKWNYDIGGNGWGNHELETYTSHPENA